VVKKQLEHIKGRNRRKEDKNDRQKKEKEGRRGKKERKEQTMNLRGGKKVANFN